MRGLLATFSILELINVLAAAKLGPPVELYAGQKLSHIDVSTCGESDRYDVSAVSYVLGRASAVQHCTRRS